MQRINNEDILEITILSIEEYEVAKDNIPLVDGWCWLRTPGLISSLAVCVVPDGDVYVSGCDVIDYSVGVRPALRVNPESINLSIIPIRGKTLFGGEIWTRIAEDVFLCDRNICQMPFRKDHQAADANYYDTSDIKPYLDEWLENAIAFQARPNDIVLATYAFDGGFTREEILDQLMMFPADARVVPFVVSGRMEATGFIEETAVEKLLNEGTMGSLKNHIEAILDGKVPEHPDSVYESYGMKIYLK